MRKYSMKSQQRRKHQRWFNEYCRYINKTMVQDELFLGRFYVSQAATYFETFEDHSGGIMYADIVMHDKKTKKERHHIYDGLEMDYKFWADFNDFIIDDCKVWEEKPDIRVNRIDYRKVK